MVLDTDLPLLQGKSYPLPVLLFPIFLCTHKNQLQIKELKEKQKFPALQDSTVSEHLLSSCLPGNQRGLLKTWVCFMITVVGNHAKIFKKMSCLCLELVIPQVNFWAGPHPKVITWTPQLKAKWRISSSVFYLWFPFKCLAKQSEDSSYNKQVSPRLLVMFP